MAELNKQYEALLNKIKNGSITQINKAFAVMINDLTAKLRINRNHDIRINKSLQSQIVFIKRQFVNQYNSILTDYESSAISLSQRKNILQIEAAIKGLEVESGLIKTWLGRPNKPNVKTVSKRVWNINKGFYSNLDSVLKSGLLEGKSAHEIKLQLTRLLNEPARLDINELRNQGINKAGGEIEYRKLEQNIHDYSPGRGVYKSSKKNAFRLARTEINRSYRKQDFDTRQNLPFVVGHEVKLSNAHEIIDICDESTGIYPKDYMFLGWHSNCFCYSVPILATKDQTARIIADQPVKLRKIDKIPKRLENYIKSKKKNIENYKTKPFFLSENPKYFDSLIK